MSLFVTSVNVYSTPESARSDPRTPFFVTGGRDLDS